MYGWISCIVAQLHSYLLPCSLLPGPKLNISFLHCKVQCAFLRVSDGRGKRCLKRRVSLVTICTVFYNSRPSERGERKRPTCPRYFWINPNKPFKTWPTGRMKRYTLIFAFSISSVKVMEVLMQLKWNDIIISISQSVPVSLKELCNEMTARKFNFKMFKSFWE